MNRTEILAGALGVAVVIWFASRRAGETTVQDTIEAAVDTVNSVQSSIRGIRNNNPGNLRHGPQWRGLRAEQTDSEFAQFDTMRAGLRAMSILLRNYRRFYGIDTVPEIIARYAPSSENNTSAYIKSVCDYLGIAPTNYVDLLDNAERGLLMRAMIRVECGNVGSALISDSQIEEVLRDE